MVERQYVIFKLSESEFGIKIDNVREIIPYEKPIPVPDTEEFIEGIINHRGDVIPIINLKKKFSIKEFNEVKDRRIIIVRLNAMEIGFMVDDASQTIVLNNDKIDLPPSIISGIDKKYIMGIGKLGEKDLLILVDLEKILSENEIREIRNIEI